MPDVNATDEPTDAERLNWLEKECSYVRVEYDLLIGGWLASPLHRSDMKPILKGSLRSAIDAAMRESAVAWGKVK